VAILLQTFAPGVEIKMLYGVLATGFFWQKMMLLKKRFATFCKVGQIYAVQNFGLFLKLNFAIFKIFVGTLNNRTV
jgi:hypothetical protein